MAMGVPVVATDVGGMREVVSDGVNGILVPARDWRMMACALEKLCMTPTLRLEMGEEAKEFVAHTFTRERQVSGFAGLFGMSE
jgi:glycosyltransferase involved in cell wall biosynthesis